MHAQHRWATNQRAVRASVNRAQLTRAPLHRTSFGHELCTTSWRTLTAWISSDGICSRKGVLTPTSWTSGSLARVSIIRRSLRKSRSLSESFTSKYFLSLHLYKNITVLIYKIVILFSFSIMSFSMPGAIIFLGASF